MSKEESAEQVVEKEEEVVDPSIGLTPLENMLRKMDVAEFMLGMSRRLKVEQGLQSIRMANAPWDYYSWPLEKRAKFLNAPTYEMLCKTMIMVNYMYREEHASDPHYPRYVVVITQYCRSISAQKLLNFAKKY